MLHPLTFLRYSVRIKEMESNILAVCGDSEAALHFDIQSDDSLILSDLSSGKQYIIVAEGSFLRHYAPVSASNVCIPANHYFDLAINDSAGSGICCDKGGGWYKIIYNGIAAKKVGSSRPREFPIWERMIAFKRLF